MLASGSAGGGVDADVTAVGGTAGGGGGGVDVDVTAVGCIASGGGGGGVDVDATAVRGRPGGGAGGGVDADVTAVGGRAGGGAGGGVDVDVTVVGGRAGGAGGGVDVTAVGGRAGGGAGGGVDAEVTAVGGRAGGSASGGVGPGAAVSSDVDVVVRSTALVVEVVVGCAPIYQRHGSTDCSRRGSVAVVDAFRVFYYWQRRKEGGRLGSRLPPPLSMSGTPTRSRLNSSIGKHKHSVKVCLAGPDSGCDSPCFTSATRKRSRRGHYS